MRHGDFSNETNAQINWWVLKLVWPFFKEFKQRIFIALLFLIAAKLASMLAPLLLKRIVDSLNSQGLVDTMLVAPVALVIAYGFARFANTLFGELRDTVFGRVTEQAMRRIGLTVFEHLHRLDLSFHLERRTGGLSRDIERGVNGVSFVMRFFVFNIIPTLLEIGLVMLYFWYSYGVRFAIVTAISVAAYILYSVLTTEWRTRFIREANKADSASNSRAIDSLLNYETVKYFTNEAFEAKRYDDELKGWEKAKQKSRLSLFALNSGQALIIAVSMTIMMLLAANDVSSEKMTIGDFVLVNAFMMQLFLPLNFLGFVYREIKGSMANIERMFELLETPAKITDKPGAPALRITNDDNTPVISFKGLNFSYTPERAILKNISFNVHKGERVAIVGPSGSGKSSLMKLLFRMYDPDSGVIKLFNQNSRDVTQQSLRAAIGVVPQDCVLFNTTIMENVRYGWPTASDNEVKDAVSDAYLESFVHSLPEGLNARVGERGLKLSGGEKQRVAIARVLLKKANIMIFDEATSSLDSHSEQAILETIDRVSQGYTSIVIAHRLSTIKSADRIIVLDKGVVVEEGGHAELLAKGGKYHAMWHIQQAEALEN